jgi:hypothetical protein
MAHPNSQRPLFIFCRPRRRRRPRKYHSFLLWYLWSDVCFLGILTRKSHLCGHRRALFGLYLPSFPFLDYSDIQILQAAKDMSTSQGKLVELFNRIGYFFRRLEIYTKVPPTPAMTDIIMEIMVKVITILGTATKEMQRGRLSELVLRF